MVIYLQFTIRILNMLGVWQTVAGLARWPCRLVKYVHNFSHPWPLDMVYLLATLGMYSAWSNPSGRLSSISAADSEILLQNSFQNQILYSHPQHLRLNLQAQSLKHLLVWKYRKMLYIYTEHLRLSVFAMSHNEAMKKQTLYFIFFLPWILAMLFSLWQSQNVNYALELINILYFYCHCVYVTLVSFRLLLSAKVAWRLHWTHPFATLQTHLQTLYINAWTWYV